MAVISSTFNILGSLGLFLFGMKLMSDGIQKAAGENMHKFFKFVTVNRFIAVFTGFFLTAIIQSSSATTVMVVSFVNAGLLQLTQAIGVILGANIGTTVTGWIISIIGFKFKIAHIALPVIGIGFIFYFYKNLNRQNLGEAFIGFGILFLGLSTLKDFVPDLKSNPEALQFLQNFGGMGFLSTLIYAAAGMTITIIVHSSSASMAIVLSMAASSWIDFPSAAAMILGSNVGTTIDAFLASLHANIHAKRAAYVHTIFNIVGVLWVLILLTPFLRLVDIIVPGDYADKTGITIHLAMFHTMFNLINTIVFIGFIPQFGKLIETIFKPKESDKAYGKYELQYLTATIQDTAEINILTAKKELSEMTDIVSSMFNTFENVFMHPDKKMKDEVNEVKTKEEYTDQMYEEISKFLIECSRESLNEVSAINVSAMLQIVNELESVGDSCFNLIVLAERRYKKKFVIPPEAITDLAPYIKSIKKFIEFTKDHLNEHLSKEEFLIALNLEKDIDKKRSNLKKFAQKRLIAGSDVKGELLYIDMVGQLEHIGDYLYNVAQMLKKIH